MGETYTDTFNIGRHIQSRRNFTRLLNSISSMPEAIVVIPDDDAQLSEGDQWAINQPIVLVQSISQSPLYISPPRSSWCIELHQTPSHEGVPRLMLFQMCLLLTRIYKMTLDCLFILASWNLLDMHSWLPLLLTWRLWISMPYPIIYLTLSPRPCSTLLLVPTEFNILTR